MTHSNDPTLQWWLDRANPNPIRRHYAPVQAVLDHLVDLQRDFEEARIRGILRVAS